MSQSGATTNIELGVAAGGTARATIDVAGTGLLTINGGSVPAGSWSHLALSWDGTTITLYVNGVWVGQMDVTGVLAVSSDPVAIGARPDGLSAFDGVIDEVRVETTARTVDWFEAIVANASAPGSFVSVGSVETGIWFPMGAWQYRKPVVVRGDQIDNDAVDVVLPLTVTDADIKAEAKPSGEDIVITAADGITRLDHIIESWDASSGTLKTWVRIPSVTANTDLTMYIYYGNTVAEDQQDQAGTFGDHPDLDGLGNP